LRLIEADLSDIIELFVRINSTGNALTRQEIRNAHFYRSEFLKTAKRLATRYESYSAGYRHDWRTAGQKNEAHRAVE
jgi:hypothetical protein